jgi:O-acetylserine/cysteine efflux transporter
MPSTPRFSSRDAAAALAIVVIWGLNFVAMKFGLRDFTPFQLGVARFTFAALPLVFFIKPPRVHWKWVLLFSLGQAVGQFGFLFTALQVGMTAALASVLMQTQVFFTALFAFAALGERLTRTQSAGLVFAVLGLGCFATNTIASTTSNSSGVTLMGLTFTLCAAASWAASNIVARKAQQSAPGYDPLGFAVWSSLVPILPFVLMSSTLDPAATRWRWMEASLSSWLAVAYLGWIATVWAYAMWMGLLKRHSANRVAPFGLGVPVVGIAAGMLVLGEQVNAWQWAGVAFIAAALLVAIIGPRLIGRKVS